MEEHTLTYIDVPSEEALPPPPRLMYVQASMGAFKNTIRNFLLMLAIPCPLSLNVTGQLKVDSHPCMASQNMTSRLGQNCPKTFLAKAIKSVQICCNE